jgi:hypothetical protein
VGLRGGLDTETVGRIHEPKRDEVTEEWGKLHYEELCNLYTIKYYYNDQIKRNEMGVACSKHGGGVRNMYKILIGKPKGKR